MRNAQQAVDQRLRAVFERVDFRLPAHRFCFAEAETDLQTRSHRSAHRFLP